MFILLGWLMIGLLFIKTQVQEHILYAAAKDGTLPPHEWQRTRNLLKKQKIVQQVLVVLMLAYTLNS